MEASFTASSSIVGKLLEEISWEKAKDYRAGGQGRENVLTAEVLIGLDFLPRNHFLGAIIRAARGADAARNKLATEAEELQMHFLPGDYSISSDGSSNKARLVVQPDAIFETSNTYTLVEAKRIRYGSFQPEQLAREYIALLSKAGSAAPILFLLGVTPPLRVKGNGQLEITEAVGRFLGPVLERVGDQSLPSESELMARIPEVFCWISWSDLDECVREAAATYLAGHPSGDASVQRVASFIHNAIAWHA
ncbi:hypothetical protein FHJ30_05585 [Arthrobacter sp. BB-1]|uniref:hypothetical protein n=1 Tax=unclassified Arthrobacter TaxID=235627 RepID=UPI001111E7BE|nr:MULTISPECIES: hypothetical protein [unclassified Arthrobacter]TNB74169.1 hypothetical protein FHJ30_05585 [Arthrobacter sp. BB-1]